MRHYFVVSSGVSSRALALFPVTRTPPIRIYIIYLNPQVFHLRPEALSRPDHRSGFPARDAAISSSVSGFWWLTSRELAVSLSARLGIGLEEGVVPRSRNYLHLNVTQIERKRNQRILLLAVKIKMFTMNENIC